MNSVGTCAYNAPVEGFLGMLKRERVNRRYYATQADARADIVVYIERFYNPRMQRKLKRQQTEPNKFNSDVQRKWTEP